MFEILEPDYKPGYVSEVDYVTPLCSQVTYEGLLDDIFGIHCGK